MTQSSSEQALQPGDRVQCLDMPGYALGTVEAITATGVRVALDTGLRLDVGEYNVAASLRRIVQSDVTLPARDIAQLRKLLAVIQPEASDEVLRSAAFTLAGYLDAALRAAERPTRTKTADQ